MLLTIQTTRPNNTVPATDLGYLLHKNPARLQTFDLSFGRTHVFYPIATDDVCHAAVLLDIDPISLVRARSASMDQYVSDRPYVASSFMSVAINKLFSTALNGKCNERPELVQMPWPLEATIAALPCRASDGEDLLRRLFEPLGYTVEARAHALDPVLAEREAGAAPWSESPYYTVMLRGVVPVQRLLQHLYVLIPVLDNDKHYWVGPDEIDKLIARSHAWLPDHPDKDLIATRYLRHMKRLTREALARLTPESDPDADEAAHDAEEERIERPLSLNRQRLGSVIAAIKASGARSVVDLGCGEGNLLRDLIAERQFTKILGMDVSVRALERAADKLRLDRMPERQREKIQLIQGSLMYRDDRLRDGAAGFDAAAVVEVVEHLDPPRLRAFERTVFQFARPRTVVVTTPNREYNVRWETLPAGHLRHRDHRFEWTRAEFRAWAERIATGHGYTARFLPVGPDDPEVGSPTQMALFEQSGDARAD